MINNVDNTAFNEALNKSFRKKIPKELFHSLANLLTLDYTLRLQNIKALDLHITECITRLKKYLSEKIIKDRSFRIVMLLFIAAISPEDSFNTKRNSTRENTAEVVANAMTQTDFSEYSNLEKEVISATIKHLLMSNPLLDMINFIRIEHKLIKEIISTILLNSKQKPINDITTELDIGSLVEKSVALDKKVSNFKRNITNITAASVAISSLIITAGVSTFLILPAAILSIKYGTKLGNKLSDKLIDNNKSINREKHSIDKIKSNIISNIQPLGAKLLPSLEDSTILEKLNNQELDMIKNQVFSSKSKTNQVGQQSIKKVSRQNYK